MFFLLLLDHDNGMYYPSSAHMWKLTSLAAPLTVKSERGVKATSENEDKIVEMIEKMIENETPVHAGSKSAYSWFYHLPSTYQSAGERMTMMMTHQAP